MLRIVAAAIAVWGLSIGAVAARAATIDTFSFTQAGWAKAMFTAAGPIGPGAPDPGGILTGTFTGTAEPGGFIQLGDLTSFSDSYSDAANPTGLGGTAMNLASLSAFSYLTMGGPSTLDIAGGRSGGNCVGGALPFSNNCTADMLVVYVPGITGAVFQFFGSPNFVSTAQPVITLVSSVTTPPAGVPEPSSLSLLAAFIGLFGFAGCAHRRRRG